MAVHYPAGPWIRSIMYFRSPDSQWQNDLWFKVTGPVPGGVDINAVAAAVDTFLMNQFLAFMNEANSYVGNTTYLNNAVYTISAETIHSSFGAGTLVALPTEDAAIVRLDSGIATRSGNGRIFVSGLDSDMVDESRLSTDGVAAFVGLKNALMGIVDLGTVPCQVGVWSRKLNALEVVQFVSAAAVLGHRTKRRPIH
jgi:hypothetical protein